MTISILVDEYALLSPSAIESANVHPLSSSPEPLNVTAEAIPMGLPVVDLSADKKVSVAPPVTDRSPAFATEIAAKELQRAEQPTLVNLFIIYLSLPYS